jgi:hypothetical protein
MEAQIYPGGLFDMTRESSELPESLMSEVEYWPLWLFVEIFHNDTIKSR